MFLQPRTSWLNKGYTPQHTSFYNRLARLFPCLIESWNWLRCKPRHIAPCSFASSAIQDPVGSRTRVRSGWDYQDCTNLFNAVTRHLLPPLVLIFAYCKQTTNIKYHIRGERHASWMPLSKISWKQCVYSISYLTYLFALTEMHFLCQKLEHAWLRKFSCWVAVALQKGKRKRYQRVPWTGQCENILHSQMWVIRRQTPSNTCPGLHLLPWVENDHAVGLRLHNVLYGCNWVSLFQLFTPQFITIQ